MTHLRHLSTTCAVCGEACRFTIPPEAAGSVGSRDLDTRPPAEPPLRSTIYAWVKRCPSCGYCAPDPGKAPEGAADVVKLPRYRWQLDARKFPGIANTFLCWSIIQEDLGFPAQAAWASLHAAWVCDDEGGGCARPDLPETCRRSPAAGMGERRAAGRPGGSGRGRPRGSAPPGGGEVPGGPGRCRGGAGEETATHHRRHHAAPGTVDRRIGSGRPYRRRGPAVQAARIALTGRSPPFVYCSGDIVSWRSRSSPPPASTPTAPC